jgi:PKD repeat protein
LVIGGLLAVTGLAGCIEAIDQESGNQAPTADLTSDRASAFAGEEFEFDASASSDPDGNVTTYRFDFGDNQSFEVKDPDEPKVRHAYDRGGEYVVTVIVIDNGGEDSERLTDTATLNVAVNENETIASQVLFASPANATAAAKYGHVFTAHEGADGFGLNLTVRSVLVAGSSELTIKVVDPNNETIAEEQVTVAAGQEQMLLLEGLLALEGDHEVVIEAKSGGASVAGQLIVYYDDGF